MNNRKNIYNLFKNEVKSTENMLNNRRLYNIRNLFVLLFLKSGISLDYIKPYILSVIMLLSLKTYKEDRPFVRDDLISYSTIEDTITSNGYNSTSIIESDRDDLLQYSTGWYINQYGLYERIVTSYNINKLIDLDDTSKIFSMSQEELECLLDISNIETINKSVLSDEDLIYNTDTIIITNHYESDIYYEINKERKFDNFTRTFGFIILSFFIGTGILMIESKYVKRYPRDILKECEKKYRIISKDEYEKFINVLKLKQDNLKLLEDNYDNRSDYCLRKKKVR